MRFQHGSKTMSHLIFFCLFIRESSIVKAEWALSPAERKIWVQPMSLTPRLSMTVILLKFEISFMKFLVGHKTLSSPRPKSSGLLQISKEMLIALNILYVPLRCSKATCSGCLKVLLTSIALLLCLLTKKTNLDMAGIAFLFKMPVLTD